MKSYSRFPLNRFAVSAVGCITFLLFSMATDAHAWQTRLQDGTSAGITNSDDDSVIIDVCLVSSIKDIAVPARVKGFITKLNVIEGQSIDSTDVIALLDTGVVDREMAMAEIRYKNAKMQAEDNTPIEYAQATMNFQSQRYRRELGLNKTGSGTNSELEQVRLEKVQAELQLKRSQAQKVIDLGAVDLETQAIETVRELKSRHTITPPFAGEVAKIERRAGEYVQEGQTILRLVDLSRVEVEGHLSSSKHDPFAIKGKPVTVYLRLAGGVVREFEGVVQSTAVEHDLGGLFKVKAVVKNEKMMEQWLLHPKATVSMKIITK